MILAMYQPCPECWSVDLGFAIDNGVRIIYCVDCRCAAPLEVWNKIERKEAMPPNKVVDPVDEDKEVEVTECEDAGEALDISGIEM